MRTMLIMLENEDTRYEFYMEPIYKSNIDSTVVRYELRYKRVHHLTLGSSVSDSRVIGSVENFISDLLVKGYKEVTFETKKFA